jgi:two-component system sensor histidine kinase HydH
VSASDPPPAEPGPADSGPPDSGSAPSGSPRPGSSSSGSSAASSGDGPTQAEQLAYFSRLAGGLAHEIKNPLSTMAINLALMQEDWERVAQARPEGAEPSPREQRTLKRVRTLSKEVTRLEGILQDFLAFVRKGQVNRMPIDLAALIDDVLEFVRPENEQAGIRQHADLQAGLPLVLADEGQIRQALLNLIVNARQAMPDGGELLVRLARVGNEAEVSVTDTGIGMNEAQLERCFDVYYSNKKGGTGLGLATTRRIVEEHGGAIRVISEPGRGTSFNFVLPLAVELAGERPGRAGLDADEHDFESPDRRDRVIDTRASDGPSTAEESSDS